MKLFALVLLLVALVALPAFAQNPDLPNIVAQGKKYQSVAAIDTIHSTLAKASSVAATKWRGPIPLYEARNTGAMSVSKYSLPNAWFVYARKPFYYKAIFANGDSSGTVSTYVDTIPRVSWAAREIFPCWTVVYGPATQFRFDTTAADTGYVVPLVLKW